MDFKEILIYIFPFLLPSITVLIFVTLLFLLNDTQYLKYQQLKTSFCTTNQLMEKETTESKQSYRTVIMYLQYSVAALALVTAILSFILEKDMVTLSIPIIIAVISLVAGIVLPTTQYSKPNYTTIIERIKEMLRNTDFITLPSNAANTNQSYFDSPDKRLIDLKNSIVAKYTAYKEEQNKNNYYVRSDIEEELKAIFANKTTPEAFATELVKYMNFPYDAKLLNQAYEQWQKTNDDCGEAIRVTNSTTTTASEKNNVAATYKRCTLKVSTTIPYSKDTQKEAPLYLTWLLLIILFYYFMHPLYQSHKFYLILVIITIVVLFMLYYVVAIRNNI